MEKIKDFLLNIVVFIVFRLESLWIGIKRKNEVSKLGNRERWVIKTNQNRYVGIPFILRSGFRSFLDEKVVWNKTRTYQSEEEASEYLKKYLSPTSSHYIDQHSFKEGERLEGIERVFV